MGDIGEGQKEYEFEPLPQDVPVHEPAPAEQPVEAPEPEKVPA